MHQLGVCLDRLQELRRAHQERGDIERAAGHRKADLVAGLFNLRLQVLEPLDHKRQQAVLARIGLFQQFDL